MNKGRKILLGVCGGISSYKVCELVRLFVKGGFSVKVVMTPAATNFVSPLVFQELSQNPVYLDMFALKNDEFVQHVSLAQWCDLCVIAPLSANTLSKIASGICDNLLTTLVLALPSRTKVLLVPAMNEEMWRNPVIQENVKKIKKIKKYTVMPPKKGKLLCGTYGEGRLPSPKEIYNKILSLMGK
jgi:phosphopantothenoylcysteine decarboxylase/phosphopantothenate--cysteine ligase